MWSRNLSFLWRFTIALFIIGTLLISGYLVRNNAIEQQLLDGAVINISGRQRMLSQRITMYSARLVSTGITGERKQDLVVQLEESIDLFETSHTALYQGGEVDGVTLPGANTVGQAALYSEIDPAITEFISAARNFAQAPSVLQTRNNEDYQLIIDKGSNEILFALNNAANHYEAENSANITRLRIIDGTILAVLLFSLALVGTFIFRPLAAEIEAQIASLRAVNSRLVAQNEVIKEQSSLLELASNVGSSIASIRSLDELLNDAVIRIAQQFELDHVQVYLTDATGRYLSYQAGTGSAGEELKYRGHRVPISPGSLIGTAAHRQNPILVRDNSEINLYPSNPLLPNTRSQMAIPLIADHRVVGILDMHSEQPGFLNETTQPAFEALSGQLATAIENANLFVQIEQTQEEIASQASRLTEAGWNEFLDTFDEGDRLRYTFSQQTVNPRPESADETINSKLFSAPINVTGATIGTLQIEHEAGQSWSEEDSDLVQAVAERIGQKIENLRLLNEAQRFRRESERALNRLTREAWDQFLVEDIELTKAFAFDGASLSTIDPDAKVDAKIQTDLRIRGESVGEVLVNDTTLQSGATQELVSAVTASLSDHIENLRLTQQTEQRLAELALLNTISDTLTSAVDLDSLILQVGDEIKQTFGASGVYIALYDEPSGMINVPYYTIDEEIEGISELRRIFPPPMHIDDSSITGHIIRTGAPLIINENIAERMENLGSRQIRGEFNPTETFLGVPIYHASEITGVISVQNNYGRRKLSANDLSLLTTVAGSVGVSIQNARLFTQTQQALADSQRQGRELQAINRVVAPSSTSQDQMQVLAEELLVVTRADQVGIALLDEKRNVLVITAAAGGSPESVDSVMGSEIPVAGNPSAETVFQTRQSIVLHDAQKNALLEAARPILVKRNVDTVAIIPILSGNSVIGTVGLDMHEGTQRFTQDDLRLAETIVFQAGNMVQNRRLFTQTQEALAESQRQQRELTAINRVVTADTDSNVYQILADSLMDVTIADQIEISMIREQGSEIEIVATSSVDQTDTAHLVGQRITIPLNSALAEIINGKQQTIIHKAHESKPLLSTHKWIIRNGISTSAFIPMLSGDSVMGLIGFHVQDSATIIENSDLEIAETIIRQSGAVLENQELFSQLSVALRESELRTEELATVNRVSQAISQALDEQELFQIVYKEISNAIAFETFSTAYVDLKNQELTYPLVITNGEQIEQESRPVADQPFAEKAIQSGKTILEHTQGRGRGRSAPVISAPLSIGNQIVGLLTIQGGKHHTYTENDANLLTGIANYVSVSLQNARLYADTSRRARRERLVNEITQKIQDTVSVESALQTTIEELGKALKARHTQVQLTPSDQSSSQLTGRRLNGNGSGRNGTNR